MLESPAFRCHKKTFLVHHHPYSVMIRCTFRFDGKLTWRKGKGNSHITIHQNNGHIAKSGMGSHLMTDWRGKSGKSCEEDVKMSESELEWLIFVKWFI